MKELKRNIGLTLGISLAIPLGAGLISAFLNLEEIQQYSEMYRPPLSPEGWIFHVVWTILYLLMGIASFRIFRADVNTEEEKAQRKKALLFYFLQLAVNVIWPFLFFKWQAYFPAFAWLLLLWYLVFRTIREFRKLDQTAARLLLPYLVWITFAGYLNFAIALHEWS